MIPAVFWIGPVPIHIYGLLIGLAIVAGTEVAVRAGKRHGMAEGLIWAAAAWAMIGGIIGARLYHVVDQWGYYREHLNLVVAVWNGGLGIIGAIIGGLMGLAVFSWRQKYRGNRQGFRPLLDAAAFGLPIGQAIGRWGNYINQELYGKPTNLPWGIYIPPDKRAAGWTAYTNFHPLFWYESLLMVGLYVVLRLAERQHWLPWGQGAFFAWYLVGYGVIRFSLEELRIDNWRLSGWPVASMISLLFIMVGVGWLLMIRRRINVKKI